MTTSTQVEPTPTVYSWYLPEISDLIRDLVREYPTQTFRENYSPGLDDLHQDLLESYRVYSLSSVFTASSIMDWDLALPNSYYTNGSSEGIFHLLARHKTYFPSAPLYCFEGEYQGYEEYARTLGLTFTSISFGTDVDSLPSGVFFVSAPSAVDGNIVKRSVVDKICGPNSQHYIVLDTAYAGMACYQDFEKLILNDRVTAVVGSMSKPFGLYYHRIGFLWSRDPVASLYGNRWFKNALSIKIGDAVLEEYTADYFARKYRPWQTNACRSASALLGVEVKPSDVWLLGHVYPDSQGSLPLSLGPFRRGPGYRLCLTPYYMSYERDGIHA